MFDTLLSYLEKDVNISDILISEWQKIAIRRSGTIEIVDQLLDEGQMDQIISEILLQNATQWTPGVELDIGYHSAWWFFYRINCFLKSGSRAMAIRKITNSTLELEDIMTTGLAKTLQQMILDKTSGLFLVTGTAGSWKSTTLMACLEYINSHFPKHIVTLEDPIEFVFKNKLSLFSQRQIGKDTQTFWSGLKSLLRQNPDVILVGEIRDPESAEAVITIAETGHLVLSTLHTKAAINTVSRLVSFFPPHYQDSIKDRLADVFLGSLAQHLMKAPESMKENAENKRIIWNHFARIATYELMLNNTAISNTIRKWDFKQIPSLIQTGKADGMIEMSEYEKIIGI